MVNGHMKRRLALSIIREMQIKTTMRYSLTPARMAIIKKIPQTINAREGVKRRESFYTFWWECKLVQPLWRTVWKFLKKLKMELPYDPAIPLLGICLQKNMIRKYIFTLLFIAALFTIAKTWKQLKCPSTEERIKKTRYKHTQPLQRVE